MQAQLIPVNRPAEAKAAGIPVDTEDQLRWLERTADEKGLRPAFVRIGRRVYIDPARFHELVRQQSSSVSAQSAARRGDPVARKATKKRSA